MSTTHSPFPIEPSGREGASNGLSVRHLMSLIFYCAVGFSLATTIGWPSLIYLCVVVAVGGSIIWLRQRRGSHPDLLLGVLATATRRRMPLAGGVEALAALLGGAYRAKVERLAWLLRAGLSLPDALDRVPGVLPSDSAFIIRVGWEGGMLPAALEQAAEDRVEAAPGWADLSRTLFYPLMVVTMMTCVSSLMMYFLTPRIEAILLDFQIPLPPITARVLGVVRSWPAVGFGVVVGCVNLAILLLIPAAYFGRIDAEPQFLDRLFSRRHKSIVLRSLALSTAASRPLGECLAVLADYYPRSWVRRRLVRVRTFVADGADWVRALEAQGLVDDRESAVLSAAVRAGNVSWALREVADASRRRSRFRRRALLELLFPALILALGAVVLAFAVGYFLPLITVIEDLAR